MAAKPNEKNIPFSSHKSDAPYKIKSAAQQDAAQSDSSQSSSNMKRPRGRPPLVTATVTSNTKTKPFAKVATPASKNVAPVPIRSHGVIQQPKVSNNFVAASSILPHAPIVHSKPAPVSAVALVITPQSNQNQAPSSSSTTVDTAAAEPGGEQQNKVPKPSATEVTNKLLAVLMVSEPTSAADLCKQLPELPRESIQSVLEVLQVLGLVIQMMSSKETGSKSSSASNIVYQYALAEFAKFSAPFPIAQLQAETRGKQEATQEVKSRNQELQALSVSLEDDSLDPDTRNGMMRDTLDRLVQQNPALWEDPLYQALLEHGQPASPMESLLL